MKKTILWFLLVFAVAKDIAQITNTFPSSGNAGIGTTSPLTPLHLEAGPGANATILFGVNGTRNGYMGQAGSNGSLSSGAVTGDVVLRSQTNLLFTSGGDVSRFYLKNNGNVGIGVTSPLTLLHLESESNTNATILIGVNGTHNGYLGQSAINGSLSSTAVVGDVILRSQTNLLITAGGDSSHIYIKYNGNIGMGTSSPSEKLSVEGNISANGHITTKKLIVTQLGWSDYVFAKEYKLRSLSSLEAFINQYKHLPEVPTAKEVEAKGISVGDNQALLLKKIEELILYVIAMNKKDKELEQSMLELRRSNERLTKRLHRIERGK